MKKLLFVLLLAATFIPSCSESPVSSDAPKQPVAILWDSVYFSAAITNLNPYNGWGYFSIGGGDFSNCDFVRIKLKYISYYIKNYLPPTLNITNSSFYTYLKNDTYGSLDTTLKSSIFKGIGTAFISLSYNKLSYDTIMILKGRLNY